MRIRHWPDDDAHFARAEDELLAMSAAATFKERRQHFEAWRSPKRTGGGLHWLIDTRPHPGGTLPRVIWVGLGAVPFDHFLIERAR